MAKTPSLELAEIATSTDPLPERSQELLASLRRLVPFDAAWLALADPMSSSYTSLASTDLDHGALDYLSGPQTAHDIEVTQTDRPPPPLSPPAPPSPAGARPTGAECLPPAGSPEALAAPLFDSGNRHVGLLALFASSTQPPAPVVR